MEVKAMDRVRAVYRGAWWALMLRGVLAITLGAIILWRPLDSIAAFALTIALWALFSGFVEIIHAVELRHVFGNWWVALLGGLISVGFGFAALRYYPQLSLAFAVVWATWWLFMTGVVAISIAFMQRRLGMGWGWTLAFGVLAFASGVVAIMNPPATLASIMGLIAGFALASGFVLVMGAFRLSAIKERLAMSDAHAMSERRIA